MAEAPDGGWGWAIVMATFLTSFLSAGSGFSIGVIYAALLDAFGKSKATTAWVASILAFAMSMSYLLGVASARRIGHRKTVMICGFVTAVGFFSSAFVTELYQLYFTYGVLVGIGCGAPYICCIEMIGHYFKRKLTVALGFGMMGAGAGQLVLSFVCQLLVDNYGWRGMLIIMSAVTANICVAGALLRPLDVDAADPREAISTDSTNEKTKSLGINDKKENDDNVKDLASPGVIDIANQSPDAHPSYERKKTLICSCCTASKFKDLLTGSLLFQPVFILQLIVNILQMSGIFSVLVHAVRHSRDLGTAGTLSSYISSVMGLGQLISRPLFGAIGYSPKVKPYVTYSFAAVVCGVATITIIYTRNFAGQLIAIFVLGAGIGGCLVYVPVILAYFHGKENIGLGASLIAPCHGVMALTVPTFAGWLRDRYGDYKEAFWLAVLSYFVAAAVAMSLPFVDATVKRRRKSRKGRLCKNVHDEFNDRARETKTELRTMEQHR